jgi:competence protein ComEC
MRDRAVLAMAIGAWVGAIVGWPVPRVLAFAALTAAFVSRRPTAIVAGVVLLAASLASAAHDGLEPAAARSFSGEVVLVGDPVAVRGGAWRVDVRAGGRRYEAMARGAEARVLRGLAAGDQVRLSGRVRPRPPAAPWLEVRHIVGRLEVTAIDGSRPGAPALRLANAVRSALARGAASLAPVDRPLYAGLVYGDDRGQSPVLVDDLRAAGLGHLLAVSGQNVAVLLGAARPLLDRCRYRVRFPATLALLGLLVLVTRAEPSVLRATAMSGVVALAAAMGRSSSAVRVLALAVTGLVLVDPILVHAVGFQLSVAASAGIVVLAGPIASRLPLPATLAEVVGVTLAAQLAVAPIVIHAFGGIPVAALPANVLAAPAAAPVMVWGATAGVVAGLVGGPFAAAIHLPTRVLLWWIREIGAVAGRVPFGELEAAHIALLVMAALIYAVADTRSWVRTLAVAAMVVVLAQPAWSLRSAECDAAPVVQGVVLWHGDGSSVVVVAARADPVRALEALRRAGVRRLDLVVAVTGGSAVRDVVSALDGRYDVGAIWAPSGHQIRGAGVPEPGLEVRAGSFVVAVEANEPRLVVEVRSTSPSREPR